MRSRKQHSGPPVRQPKVSRRQADEARQELAAGGLSHQERRKLRSEIRIQDAAADRRSFEFRHIIVVVAGTLAAMAVVAVLVGLVSAIGAARGQGTAGTFVAESHSCSHRTGCVLVGTFRSQHGITVPGVIYAGYLPADVGPGMTFPAIQPAGSDYVYPPHGSTRWVSDLLITVLVGAAVGFLLLVIPIGLRRSHTSDAGVV